MKKKFIKFAKIVFNFLGLDLRKIIALRNLPKFILDFLKWRSKKGPISSFFPILSDLDDFAGITSGHYFHQDLLVAQLVLSKNLSHVDIGSRIDGFVSHIASTRPIEIWDIRSLEPSVHSNIIFKKLDLMGDIKYLENSVESLSCLHALEHFGLGRYGDPINPKGHIVGLKNMIKILKTGGFFYISIPLDIKNTIQFNAHRTFNPTWILNLEFVINNLKLLRFDYIDGSGSLHKNIKCKSKLPNLSYSCGIYTFIKV